MTFVRDLLKFIIIGVFIGLGLMLVGYIGAHNTYVTFTIMAASIVAGYFTAKRWVRF